MRFWALLFLFFAVATAAPATETTTTTSQEINGLDTPEMYANAMKAWYHAHPEELKNDIAAMSSEEFKAFVPSDFVTEFHLNEAEIAKQLELNDAREVMEANEVADEELQALLLEEADAEDTDTTEMEVQQFRAGFARGGGAFVRGGRVARVGVGRVGVGRVRYAAPVGYGYVPPAAYGFAPAYPASYGGGVAVGGFSRGVGFGRVGGVAVGRGVGIRGGVGRVGGFRGRVI